MGRAQRRALEAIYAAALNPSLWHNALGEISAASGGVKTYLLSVDADSTHTRHTGSFGYDPDYVKSWDAYYSRINAWAEGFITLPVGQTRTNEAMCAYDTLRRTEFYNDWVRPQENLVGGVGVVLKRTRTQTIFFGGAMVEKQRGDLEPRWQQDIATIGPAVRHAIETNGMLLGLGLDLLLTQQKLDPALDRAVLLVDQVGRVIHTNAAADHLLDTGDLLRTDVRGHLVFHDLSLQRALRSILEANARPEIRALRAGGSLAVRLLSLSEPTLAALRLPPMPSGRRAAAVVVVGREIFDERPHAQIVAAFGLTDAEASVSLSLADGMTPEEIAARRGVSIHTIRNQIKSALSKTGSRRQAELAAAVARHRIMRP